MPPCTQACGNRLTEASFNNIAYINVPQVEISPCIPANQYVWRGDNAYLLKFLYDYISII